MTEPRDRAVEPPAATDAPDAHGKFSLSEDWTATLAGLALLGLCLAQVVPDIGGWR
ncbi:MAG: hypothetical protein GXX90_06240 [Microbacteriaceae bacterium]|nr:hypothetical protein [Microbacteriaceae bacterium]